MPPPAHAPHHKTGVRHDGALDILGRILKKEGPLGWYQVRTLARFPAQHCSDYEQGMGAQVLKAVLSQGVLFMSKDQFERWALVLMATLYRLQRS
jgi:adenine nucleotide transporter 17